MADEETPRRAEFSVFFEAPLARKQNRRRK